LSNVYKKKPWIRGLVETLTAVKLLRQSSIETRNRQALILLDSVVEIGFKNFLIYEKEIKLEKNNALLQYRDKLHAAVKDKTTGLFEESQWTDKSVWKLISFYYEARCDLYHEIAEKTLSDSNINDFYDLVSFVLEKLFAVPIKELVLEPSEVLTSQRALINLSKLRKPIDFFVVAVANSHAQSPKDLKLALKKLGSRREFGASMIASYVFGESYGHLFHKNEETGWIELTESGLIHYRKLENLVRSSD
jgi:hypothetical protein